MKMIFKTLPVLFLVIVFANIHTDAQEMALNSKERFLQLKKIKLLETLEMDEQTANTFLIKFSVMEKEMAKIRDDFDELNSQLNKLIRQDASEKELEAAIKKVEHNMEQMLKVRKTFMSEAKKLLSTNQYAKYLLFEFKFEKQVHRLLMRKHRGGNGDGGRGKPNDWD